MSIKTQAITSSDRMGTIYDLPSYKDICDKVHVLEDNYLREKSVNEKIELLSNTVI